jgi:hypothetical protein
VPTHLVPTTGINPFYWTADVKSSSPGLKALTEDFNSLIIVLENKFAESPEDSGKLFSPSRSRLERADAGPCISLKATLERVWTDTIAFGYWKDLDTTVDFNVNLQVGGETSYQLDIYSDAGRVMSTKTPDRGMNLTMETIEYENRYVTGSSIRAILKDTQADPVTEGS